MSGYTGGHVEKPNYDQVSGGYTGHVEAVEIIYDTREISYSDLLTIYWQITDPTDAFGQFQDRGKQYRPVIFIKTNVRKISGAIETGTSQFRNVPPTNRHKN